MATTAPPLQDDRAAAPGTPAAGEGRPARRRLRAAVVVPVLLVVLAGGIRLWRVTSPHGTYGDETFYALDGWAYLGGALPLPNHPVPPAPTIYAETSWAHPPLGKWLIAAGEGPTQDSVLGMRLPSVVFGTLGVLLVYLIALELFGSVWWAGLAGLFVALDGIHIVQSRIAMLDIFLSTFVSAGFLFMLRDRRRIRDGAPPRAGSRLDRRLGNRDRALAGIAFGAAVAVKWDGLWALTAALALTCVWIARAEAPGPARRAALRSALTAYLLLPAAVYLASYTEFFVQHPVDVVGFVRLQWYMLQTNRRDHYFIAATSPAWTWPLMLHPIRYFPSAPGADPTKGTILALGNPVVFWGFLAALPAALFRAVRRHDTALRLVLGFYAVMFLPWLALSRSQYFYYVLPCVPFMALATVGVLRSLAPRPARALAGAGATLTAAAAVLFVPVWLGLPASATRLELLRWLPRWH